MRLTRVPVFVAILLLLPVCAGAGGESANLLPNPSFESGAAAPDGWSLFSLSGGGWEFNGHGGERCASVTGNGDDSSWWAAGAAPVQPSGLYRVSYWVRRRSGEGGLVIAGLNTVNRDSRADEEWGQRQFFFRAPAALGDAFFRLGQWHHKGALDFDDASLAPALVIHRRVGGVEMPLGAGERITDGWYSASHALGGPGATDFRCLERFTSGFNTDRWTFYGTAEVVYRHSLGRLRQTDAEVEVGINLLERGSLVVEASRDQAAWFRLGEAAEATRVAFPLPPELLPAREVYIRLRTEGDTSLQVNHYQYRSLLPEAETIALAVGGSQYLALLRRSADLEVRVEDLGDLLPAGRNQAELVVRNLGSRRILRIGIVLRKEGAVVWESDRDASIAPGGTQRVTLTYGLGAPGTYEIALACEDVGARETLWEARGEFMVSPLHDSGGELLSDDPQLAVWWCEPERKVSRTRRPPEKRGDGLRISAAGNEYEAAQLVLTPAVELAGCRLAASDLVSDSGARLDASDVEIRSVEYVYVAEPTDEVGEAGEWPDPLPLHAEPTDLSAERNQAFWVTVHVPAGTPAGDYRGEIAISAPGLSTRVPLQVHVWGFDLPRETHVRSGFGLSLGSIKRYHNLETDEEVQQVADLYLRSFAAHRVAPYSVGREIEVTWDKLSSGKVEPRIDFSGFDAAAQHALDELGFNSFVLPLRGLGGGTFHSRVLGEIAGYEQGTPQHEAAFRQYARAVQRHLAEKGWLDKAYVYWFDEPESKDYDFVREGMELIHRGGPGLTRMLTTHPTSLLYGAVDLWCLPTYTLDPVAIRERQRAGEEIWWYLCTGPKAPYFTLFLDHHGTEMRLWLWETWKYGLSGILVWATNYWTSDTAYPPPSRQNPWRDAMSWQVGYGTPSGAREPWGNGDGRFFYPPNRDPAGDTTKHLEGPVPSIRWELLRDGIEDYEYFWLLRSEVERLRKSGADASAYEEAEKLLEVPADVCADLTTFTISPEPIHRHRAKLAEAIEGLRSR